MYTQTHTPKQTMCTQSNIKVDVGRMTSRHMDMAMSARRIRRHEEDETDCRSESAAKPLTPHSSRRIVVVLRCGDRRRCWYCPCSGVCMSERIFVCESAL